MAAAPPFHHCYIDKGGKYVPSIWGNCYSFVKELGKSHGEGFLGLAERMKSHGGGFLGPAERMNLLINFHKRWFFKREIYNDSREEDRIGHENS